MAILASRAYRRGMSTEEGLRMLDEMRDQWFSAEITDALRQAVVGVI